MAITLWAGASAPTTSAPWTTSANRLPSPDSMEITYEQIWDENAGRNAKGTMVAKYVASKYTYSVKWGMMIYADFSTIRSMLRTGTFFFTWNSDANTPPTSASKVYRSELAYSVVQAGSQTWVKDLTVSIIQW